MDINNTIIHYINNANPTIEERLLSNARLDICKECPYKSEETVVSRYDNNEYKTWRCTACGCPLIPKSHRLQKGLCPIKSWNDVENEML